MKAKSLSHVRLSVTPWTIAYETPLSMEISRQECWSGLPFLSPGDLPDPGIESGPPALQAEALPLFRGFPGGSGVKASAWNAGNPDSIPGSGRSPGEGNGNPLQYSCLENPMEGGAW